YRRLIADYWVRAPIGVSSRFRFGRNWCINSSLIPPEVNVVLALSCRRAPAAILLASRSRLAWLLQTVPAIALLGLGAAAMAQAPANDNPTNAQVISGQAGRLTASTVNATKDPSEPAHPLNAGGKSIWYAWTAAATNSIRFDTVGSGFDTILAVY